MTKGLFPRGTAPFVFVLPEAHSKKAAAANYSGRLAF